MMLKNIILVLLLTAGLNTAAHAQTPRELAHWQVIDGDTIRHGDTIIRLWGIDAPEINQRCLNDDGSEYKCGEESKYALEHIIKSDPLVCEFINKDRYDRDVARCYLGGADIGGLMVKLGRAIDYRRYSKGHYAAEQFQAQKKGLGVWKGEFQTPSDFRRSRTSL